MFWVSLPIASSKLSPPWNQRHLLSLSHMQYIGQAAYISQNKGAYSNPFFNSVPPGMFYPSLVIAILAAIVASQTMITATFQVRVAISYHVGVYQMLTLL